MKRISKIATVIKELKTGIAMLLNKRNLIHKPEASAKIIPAALSNKT